MTLYEAHSPQTKQGRVRADGPEVDLRLYVDHADDSRHWIGTEPGDTIAREEFEETPS